MTTYSNTTRPILGENITLDVTLERTGNGTEYPGVITFGLLSRPNVTWGFTHVASEKEYDSLFAQEEDEGVHIYYSDGGITQRIEYLTTPSMTELERDRQLWEDRTGDNGCISMCKSSRFDSRYGDDGQTVREFWYDDPQERYQFTVEIPL